MRVVQETHRFVVPSSARPGQADKSFVIVLGVILARAGSKGLPDKCVRPLLGRPVIDYTFDHAQSSRLLTAAVLTTDSIPAKEIATRRGIEVIDRPAELAIDTATVDAAARHAVETWEARHGQHVDAVVCLYGNIPVRAGDLIDRAIERLRSTGADSVRSVAPVTKQHPDWVHRLDGDRMAQFRINSIYRRQDLEPLYYHDGAVAAVTRKALFGALDTPTDHQSFLGKDRRAIVCRPEDAVDIDGPVDLALAEALLRPADTLPDSKLAIAGRLLGPQEPIFVIAEAGVNHNGDVELALHLVDSAADAGADAVKFQIFRAADLASTEAATVAYQRNATAHTSQRSMLEKLELQDADLARIKNRCVERNILFLGTPFGADQIARLTTLGVPAIKIASSDLNNHELLRAAAGTSLPLILSTGAATRREIEECVRLIDQLGARKRLSFLHCVSAYPAPLDAANLRAIGALQARFGVPTGFSDHTTTTITGALAVMAGASIVEKHFTLDRSMTGPDHAMSLSPADLRIYVDSIRIAEQARGNGALGFCPQEREVREAARRSVVTSRPITRGTQITRSMLTLKRPGTGISPQDIDQLVGRIAASDIPNDSLLSWNMLR